MTSFLNSHNLNILDNEFLSACFQETSVNDFQNNESDLAHRIPIAKLARNSIVNTNMTAPKALNSDKYKATSISESVGPFTPKEQSTDSSHHNNAESSCGLGSNASELDCRPLAPSFLPSVDDYSATSTDSALMEYNPDLSFCTSLPNRASSQSAMSGRYFETPPRLIDSQAATNKACMSAMPASSLAVRAPTPSSYKQKKPRSSYGDLKSYAKNFFSVKFEEPVWPPDVEAAFREALACVPKHGRCKIIVESSNGRTKPLGRNELISEYIFRKTGKYRSRKQVSSHIQVLKHMKVNDAQLRALLEDDNTTNSSADGIGKRSFFFPDCNQPIHPDRRYSEPTALRQERQQTSSPATDENGFLMPSSISCRSASFCAPLAQSRRSSSVSSNFEDHNKVLQQYIIPMPKSSPQYLEMNVTSSSNQDFKFSIETFSLKFIEKFNSVSRQFGCTDFLSSICSPERLYHGLANQQIHHPQFANVMSQFLGVIPIIVLKHMVKLPSVMESTHRSSLETVFRFSVLSECMSLTDYTLCSTEVYIRGQLQNSAEPVILQSFHQEQSDISLTPKVLLQLPLPCDFILRYFDYASSLPPLKQEAELKPRSSQELSQTTALKDLFIVQHLMPISEQNHTPSSTTAVVHTFDLLCLHDERAAWPMSEAFMFYAM